MTRALTAAERRRYVDEGLVFPIRVLSAEEVRRYREACDELERKLGGRPRTVEVRQMHLHFRWACELATHPRIVGAVQSVLGPNLLVWATELFAKPPQESAISIGWHRDRPYMGFDSATTTTAWVALSECHVANGCLQAIPGPDRASVERHDRDAVDVTLLAGEMSLHDSDVLHGSRCNVSDTKRVGFAIRFVTPRARPLGDRPAVIRACGNGGDEHFQVVPAPVETFNDRSLAEMRQSAARHFETMLDTLSQFDR